MQCVVSAATATAGLRSCQKTLPTAWASATAGSAHKASITVPTVFRCVASRNREGPELNCEPTPAALQRKKHLCPRTWAEISRWRPTPPPAASRNVRFAHLRSRWRRPVPLGTQRLDYSLNNSRKLRPKTCDSQQTATAGRAPGLSSPHGGPSPPPAKARYFSLTLERTSQAPARNLRFATTAIEDRAGQPPPREGRTASFTASLYPSNYSRAPKPRNRAPLQTAPIGRASRRHPTRRELLGKARSSFRCRRLTLCENHLEPPCSGPTVIDRAPGRFILFCN